MEGEERDLFVNFIEQMLQRDPNEWPSAAALAEHEWLVQRRP